MFSGDDQALQPSDILEPENRDFFEFAISTDITYWTYSVSTGLLSIGND